MGAVEAPAGATSVDVERIYREHLGKMIRLLRGGFRYHTGEQDKFTRVEGAMDIEEICQETFSRFLDQVEKGNYDPERPAGPYLNRIAMNVTLRRLGRSWKEEPVETFEETADEETAFDHLVGAETKLLVEAFKKTLEDDELVILQRCMIDGVSQAKAGDELGQSRDKVYRTLQKIRSAALEFFRKKGWDRDA